MNRKTFSTLLHDELGATLAFKLISIDFDTPVSFMIGETLNEILSKIQQTLSRHVCHKFICNDQCLLCSLTPPNYAKLAWFVQRLTIMSPLTKPFIKPTSTNKLLDEKSPTNQQDLSSNDDRLLVVIGVLIIILIFIMSFVLSRLFV